MLTKEQAADVRAKGFFKKVRGVILEKDQWMKVVDMYPLPKLCCSYLTKGFACAHGASGKLSGGCRKRHKNWADLSTEEKAKLREWVTTHSTTVTLLES